MPPKKAEKEDQKKEEDDKTKAKGKQKDKDEDKKKPKKPSIESDAEEEEPHVPATQVYLYMQLQQIENLPEFGDNLPRDLVIDLQHEKDSIQKLQESPEKTTRVTLDEVCRCCLEQNSKPTFTVRVTQDDLDELNVFCDTPVLVTLFQRIKKHKVYPNVPLTQLQAPSEQPALSGEAAAAAADIVLANDQGFFDEQEIEGEWQDERWEPLAEGYLDLFPYFSHKRTLSSATHFLYPIYSKEICAVKLTWQLYTLLPLLKSLSFNNIAFITLESLYNTPLEMLDDCEDIVVDLSFRAKASNDNNEQEIYKICSFTNLHKALISEQDINHTWNSLLQNEHAKGTRLCHQSGMKMNVERLFHKLLGTEFVDFHFDEINKTEQSAMVCNSVHRYVLSPTLNTAIEQAIAFNEQDIVIEVYRQSLPEAKLLLGELNLSVLLYPFVNSVRFAVELKPPEKKKRASEKGKKGKGKDKDKDKDDKADKGKAKDTRRKSSKNSLDIGVTASNSSKRDMITDDISSLRQSEGIILPTGPIFAIIAVCLQSPLTEGNELLPRYNQTDLHRMRATTCRRYQRDPITNEQACEENYRNFDHSIVGIINDIVSNDIVDIEKSERFYCCHLANLVNRVTKLVGCDFNQRIPTKTSGEFTNLMTTVYKELNQRAYNVLKFCMRKGLDFSVINSIDDQSRQIYFFNVYKYANETGEVEFADYVLKKLRDISKAQFMMNFYKLIYDIETLNLDEARSYFKLDMSDQFPQNRIYTDLAKIYIRYLRNVQRENPIEESYVPGEDEANEEGAEEFNEEQEEEEVTNSMAKLMEDLDTYAFKYSQDIIGWILLYCFYRRHGYLAGMEYARWNFENLYKKPFKELIFLPISRWQMYNHHDMQFKTVRSDFFYKTFETMLQIGAYHFAAIVFEEIETECTDFERYAISSTLQMFMKEDMSGFKTKTFPTGKAEFPEHMKSMNHQVNGNLEFYRGNIDKAMSEYSNIFDMQTECSEDFEDFALGMLRYGFKHLREGAYDKAHRAFKKCVPLKCTRMLACLGMGKTSYRLGCLKNAETYFVNVTKLKMYIPDVWGWLALVNLKLNDNFKALECWKHARLNPNYAIHEEILAELEKINYSDVFLWVDVPNPDTESRISALIERTELGQDPKSI